MNYKAILGGRFFSEGAGKFHRFVFSKRGFVSAAEEILPLGPKGSIDFASWARAEKFKAANPKSVRYRDPACLRAIDHE